METSASICKLKRRIARVQVFWGETTGILGLDRGLQTFFPWENWIIFVRWLLGNYWIMNMQIMPGFFFIKILLETQMPDEYCKFLHA